MSGSTITFFIFSIFLSGFVYLTYASAFTQNLIITLSLLNYVPNVYFLFQNNSNYVKIVLNSDHIQEFCWKKSIAVDPDLDQKIQWILGFRSEKSVNPDPDQKITWIEKLQRS